MEEHRKNAYRYLLYWAFLEIRSLSWHSTGFFRMLNPLEWRRGNGRIHRAGNIADGLHNLAMYSSSNFEGFDEERFWRDFENSGRHHPEYDVDHYRRIFKGRLAELKQKCSVE